MNKECDKEFYEELSGKELTNQGVFEAENNFIGFFDLLLKIDQRNKKDVETKNN